MIVAKWNNTWTLACRGDPYVPGVSLSLHASDRELALAHGFSSPGNFWAKYFPSLTGIRFFPKARWRGTRLFVAMWSWGQTDPRPHVGCSVNLPEIDQERWFGRTGLQYAELIEPCAKLGWRVDLLDAAVYGAVPIDELELTEGPPPEGVF